MNEWMNTLKYSSAIKPFHLHSSVLLLRVQHYNGVGVVNFDRIKLMCLKSIKINLVIASESWVIIFILKLFKTWKINHWNVWNILYLFITFFENQNTELFDFVIFNIWSHSTHYGSGTSRRGWYSRVVWCASANISVTKTIVISEHR